MNTNHYDDTRPTDAEDALYIEGMINAGYDPAYDDPDNHQFYCQHGTYIGSPYGPDYMCMWCEDGISAKKMHAIVAKRMEMSKKHDVDLLWHLYTSVTRAMPTFRADVATFLTEYLPQQAEDRGLTEDDLWPLEQRCPACRRSFNPCIPQQEVCIPCLPR